MTDAARWHEFAYEQTDIPAGMTVREWRTQRARTRPTSRRWSRIVGVTGSEGMAATLDGCDRAMLRLTLNDAELGVAVQAGTSYVGVGSARGRRLRSAR